jgi:acetyltransferase-like isoleucine patch superfamily enzyme
MAGTPITWLDHQGQRISRYSELIRGRIIQWRGAKVGRRFGSGHSVTLLYPKCFKAGDDVTIGDSSFLHCLSERGVHIGNHTSIDRNLWLHCGGSMDSYKHGFFEIGDWSFIGCNAVIGAGGGITIGSHVQIGQCVNFHAENHCFDNPSQLISEQGVSYEGIVIEDDVWISSKATILDGVTIGKGAVIGAGAVVTHSIPPYTIAVGVPARPIRLRGKKEK